MTKKIGLELRFDRLIEFTEGHDTPFIKPDVLEMKTLPSSVRISIVNDC